MYRIVGGLVVLLLAWPALADDKPKDKPKETDKQSPAEQYRALVTEYNQAQQDFFKAYQEAKTQQDKQKVLTEKRPQPEKYAAKFLVLAEKYPKEPAAVDSLVWIVQNTFAPPNAKDSPRAKAIGLMLRDHIESDKLGIVCQSLGNNWQDQQAEALLRGILEKSKSDNVKSEAVLALGHLIGEKANVVRQLRDENTAKRYTQFLGKETVEALQKTDLAKLEAQNEQLFKEFAEKYLPLMEQVRVDGLIQRFGYSSDKGSETVLRTVLERDKRHDIQGKACLALAESLKRRAEGMPEAEAKEAEKLQKESESLFERVEKDFSDVKSFRGTLADQAKSQLFELRFLSKGKPAPEIKAEDLDGKEFKLSDYKGKVVLLDFWGNW
jgi:hypothetical protein